MRRVKEYAWESAMHWLPFFLGAARARVSDIGKGGRHNKWVIIITIIVLVKLVHSLPTRALRPRGDSANGKSNGQLARRSAMPIDE